MENEIKVGEFIRTNRGHIGKIKRIELDKIDKSLKWYVFDHKEFEINIIKEEYINKPYIVKHSSDLIDLIEEGDYVNGEIIDQIQNDRNPKLIWHLSSYGDDDMAFKNEDIETVATKEMMESISYKVTKM